MASRRYSRSASAVLHHLLHHQSRGGEQSEFDSQAEFPGHIQSGEYRRASQAQRWRRSISACRANLNEPPKRLVGWQKVKLDPGASQNVTIEVDQSDSSHPMSYWDTTSNSWKVASGTYTVYLGNSSATSSLCNGGNDHRAVICSVLIPGSVRQALRVFGGGPALRSPRATQSAAGQAR